MAVPNANRVIEGVDFAFEPPNLDVDLLVDVARRSYGIESEARALVGERDQNVVFGIDGPAPTVFKVASHLENRDLIDVQIDILLHLEAAHPSIAVPRIVRTINGDDRITVSAGGARYVARMVTYIPGIDFEGELDLPTDAVSSIGRVQGKLCRALADFGRPTSSHFVAWNVDNGLLAADDFWAHGSPALRTLAEPIKDRLLSDVLPTLGRLRKQWIHNDAHAGNMIRTPGSHDIVGVIDFGDVVVAPILNDLAVAIAGFMEHGAGTYTDAALDVAAGYASVVPLDQQEVESLHDAVTARLMLAGLLFDYQLEVKSGYDHVAPARARNLVDLEAWLSIDRRDFSTRALAELGHG